MALPSAAYATDTIQDLKGNPDPPPTEAEHKTFQQAKDMLLSKIIAGVPSQIADLVLTPTRNPTLQDLVQSITSHLDTTNADDQKYRKEQTQQAHFMPGMALQEYVSMHENIIIFSCCI